MPVRGIRLALVAAQALGASLACEAGSQAPAGSARAEARAPGPTFAEARPVAAQSRHERPLPAFSGSSFAGERISIASFLGRRLVLFFFDAGDPSAEPAARAVAAIATYRGKHNFQIVGVASRAATPDARAFIERQGLDFTNINDASGAIARKFGLRAPAALIFVDAEGYVTGAMGADPEAEGDVEEVFEAALRERLRLPQAAPALLEPALGEYPLAPDFEAGTLDGQPFEFASLRGRPAILLFFLHTCPHCHEALGFLKTQLALIPEDRRPVLVGVSVAGLASRVRSELAARDLDFFPVLLDPDRQIQTRYSVLAGVPDILLIDAEGRIRGRTRGWREDRDPPIMRMRLAKLAGDKVPLLLHKTGYSGNEFCGVCHENEQETWRFTRHGRAFDTLVRHAEERNEACVGCHVVGFREPGGYTISPPTPELEDVGCETCHGRGGPHLSPDFVVDRDYSTSCGTCHDRKHSLGFEYAGFAPRISHAANAHLLELSPQEKRRRLAALGETRKALFPDAAYVGSASCESCHAVEHATWKASPHARALASLEAKDKAGEADCQRCHTTGFDRPGGFPAGGQPADHAARAGVGCESCHGPGGGHVGENAPRIGTIVSLGDKCDSCVILQICGACHDDANDPGFEFRVQEKIEAQRHGTIEPGGTAPAASEARAAPEPSAGGDLGPARSGRSESEPAAVDHPDAPRAERPTREERAVAAAGGR